MTWAMIGAAAVTAVASDIQNPGSVQGGAPAPPQLGGQGQAPSIAGGSGIGQPQIQGLLGAQGVGDAIAKTMEGQPDPSPMDAQPPPVTSKPSVFNSDQQNAAMQPQQGNFFSSFLGGMDKGLQSPSQMLGLGLLSQLGGNNSALPIAGLLGMGMYNRKK